jgi:type I restriction enzyme M protein
VVVVFFAAECFEKGKRQNRLLPEHIDKIIKTYRERSGEARYARCVDMDEIEQNDFNLNISRYVSTAQVEKEIDLQAVHDDLVKIEQEIDRAKRRHNAFLKELKLPPLP